MSVRGALTMRQTILSSTNMAGGLPFHHALMSHRGGSLEHVENTLPAFRHSAGLKVDLMELDVQYTRDKQVVVFHDLLMGRMCGSEYTDKRISDYDYANLPPLRIPDGLRHLPEVADNPESTRIPLLQDLLNEFPVYPMQIDVKDSPEELVADVAAMIDFGDRSQVTVWGSFRSKQSTYCQHHSTLSRSPHPIPCFFSAWRFLQTYAMYHVGLLGWMTLTERALIMPNHPLLMSPGYIRGIQACGVSVIMFGRTNGGMNTETEWEAARHAGANGICSDAPTRLQAWLKEFPLRGSPTPPTDTPTDTTAL
ncbi:hypothetical protein BASA62_000298, partial [Batrachochytrium salamandrivorans]